MTVKLFKFILMKFLIITDLIMLALGVSFNSKLHIHDGWFVYVKKCQHIAETYCCFPMC